MPTEADQVQALQQRVKELTALAYALKTENENLKTERNNVLIVLREAKQWDDIDTLLKRMETAPRPC